ncbi:MAG: molybdopterin-dependent oxidoreductase [Solirubrobacteraceae bacterium]
MRSTPTERTVRTGCPYCGVGCGLRATVADDRLVRVDGDPDHPVNRGRTCAKPLALPTAVHAADRATAPMRREHRDGRWSPLGWDDAIGWAAGRIREIRDEHGPGSIAFYVSGQLLTEDYYVVNKLAKGFLGTNTVDSNSRLCMSSAVAGYKATFGSDGPPPSYDDLDTAEVILLLGSNAAACHPIVWQRIRARTGTGDAPFLIGVDPRRTSTTDACDLHLPVRPGGDVPLLLGMLHVIERDGLTDRSFIAGHTDGWEELFEQIVEWPPERAAEASGVDVASIEEAARRFARAGSAMALWTMGANQSSVGTDKNRALHALCLVTGQIGRPGAGPLSLTGQPNAMGGREVGGLATLLPGYRDARIAEDRADVEAYWDLPDDAAGISETPGLVATDLIDALHDGTVKAVWVMATNPAVSLPDSAKVREALQQAELLVVQDAYHPTETSSLAHLVLPAAQWPEKAGTMTGSERRVTLMRPALSPPGEALEDWRIIARLGRALGWEDHFAWRDAAAVHAEFVGLTAGRVCDQSGITHARLGRDGSVRWPFTPRDAARADAARGIDDGASDPVSVEPLDVITHAPRLYADGRFSTPTGRARLGRLDPGPMAEAPDDEHPLVLTTGRVGGQWHTMTRTGKSPELLAADPEPFVELHPDDATRAGIVHGERVRIVSRRGDVVVRARIVDDGPVPPGVAFAAFHWGALHAPAGAGQVNAVSHDVTDPVSRQPELKAMAVRVEPLVAEVERPRNARRPRRERLVIIGGGMASVAVLDAAFAHRPSSQWDTTILAGESDAPYDRVRISRLVGPDPKVDVVLRPPEWYAAHDIDLRLSTWVRSIDTDAREAILRSGERVSYDKAVICTGSRPAMPPILGLDLAGVVPFRTRTDAARLNAEVRPGAMVTVIGGGLLGLEAAAGMAAHGASVTIVHLGDRLMERQLDRGAARLLERRIRELGIQLLLGQQTERLVGGTRVSGVRFADGDELATDLVVMATGIRPEIGVALKAGLECRGAIVVDDELRTSAPNVWAVGECAEHRGTIYGLWAPIAAQARVAGATLAGQPAAYQGSSLATTLKVVGIDLFACGRPWSDTDDDEVDELMSIDTRSGIYRRAALREGRLEGAVLLGDLEMAGALTELAGGGPSPDGGPTIGEPVPDDVVAAISGTSGGAGGLAEVPDDRLVCACNAVRAGAIRAAVQDGCTTLPMVRDRTGASGGCGGCASRVEALLTVRPTVAAD